MVSDGWILYAEGVAEMLGVLDRRTGAVVWKVGVFRSTGAGFFLLGSGKNLKLVLVRCMDLGILGRIVVYHDQRCMSYTRCVQSGCISILSRACNTALSKQWSTMKQ